MVALDIAIPSPRRAPEASAGPAAGPLTVRAAGPADLTRTVALELADASLLRRLFPVLVRWPQRRELSARGTTTLVCEQPGPDGRTRICGFLVGSRHGVLELLAVDPAVAYAPVQNALLQRFHGRAGPGGFPRRCL